LPRQGTAGAYEGGFELTNTDYLLSLVGQAMPGFAMAIILMAVMILMILVYIASTICGALCCKCCNGAYKPRKFTKKDLVINKVVILVFVALTAAGCFMIFSEGPLLLDGVSDLTQAMVDTVLDLVDDGRAISDALRDASRDPDMKLSSLNTTLDSMDEGLLTVEEAIEKAQDQIEAQLDAAGSLIVAAAGAMFALSFVVFAAAFIGWWRLLILFIVVLSLGMVLAWIVWGIVAMVTTLVDDLCWAMQDYLDNPDSSDLGDLIPCMDAATALDTMTLARSMASLGIVGVNSFLEDYAGTNPYQNYLCYTYVKVRLDELCEDENEYFNDDFTLYVCKAYHNDELEDLEKEEDGHRYVWADAKCPFPTNSYKVKLGDFANEPNNATAPGVANLRCPFQGFEVELDSNGNEVPDINGKPKANLSAPIAFSMGQCYAFRQIPSDMFDKSSYSAGLAQGIIDIIPIIEGLLQCEFVDNAFERMVGPCEDMAAALTNLYTAFLLVSLGYFLTWASTLVVISRLQYYKTGCTDAGDRYKQ
jgi:energy-coupling factor transporter transmembrane protein EcfT